MKTQVWVCRFCRQVSIEDISSIAVSCDVCGGMRPFSDVQQARNWAYLKWEKKYIKKANKGGKRNGNG